MPLTISISDKAAKKAKEFAQKDHLENFGLRVGVKGGGCSGFKYDFSFVKETDENDLKHENIVIDKSSLKMLKGSQVDFTEELIGNSFKISNPKTKSSCGCGVSFSF